MALEKTRWRGDDGPERKEISTKVARIWAAVGQPSTTDPIVRYEAAKIEADKEEDRRREQLREQYSSASCSDTGGFYPEAMGQL
jgi:hypothetical protein